MPTLALFNNKGGVGKTTLTFHLAHKLAELGCTVLAVDLDPQANLTAAFLEPEILEELWDERAQLPVGVVSPAQRSLFPRTTVPEGAGTIWDCVRDFDRREGALRLVKPIEIIEGLHLLPGDLSLSSFEDTLAKEWPGTLTGDPGSIHVTAAFHRIIRHAEAAVSPQITLIDVGPNLGAINRAALLAADNVLMPLAADLFSLRGLANLGPKFREWRSKWNRREPDRRADRSADEAPLGLMRPLGYVVMQPQMRNDRPSRSHRKWIDEIPVVYAEQVLQQGRPVAGTHPHQVGTVADYGGLMAAAYRQNKPGFLLTEREDATAAMVTACDEGFDRLARAVVERLNQQAQLDGSPMAPTITLNGSWWMR